MAEKPDDGVPARDVAEFLACSVKQVASYAQEGLAIRVRPGRYALLPSVQNVVRSLRKRAAGHSDDGVSMVKAGAGFKESQTRLNEIRIKQLEGKLVSREEIEEAWDQIALATRQLFLSLPGRARFDLPHLSGKDQEVLDRLVRDMLREVAFTGKPKVPDAKVEEE